MRIQPRFGAIHVGSAQQAEELSRRLEEEDQPITYLHGLTQDPALDPMIDIIGVNSYYKAQEAAGVEEAFAASVLPDGRMMIVTNTDTRDLDKQKALLPAFVQKYMADQQYKSEMEKHYPSKSGASAELDPEMAEQADVFDEQLEEYAEEYGLDLDEIDMIDIQDLFPAQLKKAEESGQKINYMG
jgi:hypothetical protein